MLKGNELGKQAEAIEISFSYLKVHNLPEISSYAAELIHLFCRLKKRRNVAILVPIATCLAVAW